MNVAAEIVAELQSRGVRVLPRATGGVCLSPAYLIDSALRDRIYAHKAELIALLRSQQEAAASSRPTATADAPIDELRATLRRIEMIAEGGSPAARERIADLIAEAGPIFDVLVLRGDSRPWRAALLDLERHARDVVTGRGYDNG